MEHEVVLHFGDQLHKVEFSDSMRHTSNRKEALSIEPLFNKTLKGHDQSWRYITLQSESLVWQRSIDLVHDPFNPN